MQSDGISSALANVWNELWKGPTESISERSRMQASFYSSQPEAVRHRLLIISLYVQAAMSDGYITEREQKILQWIFKESLPHLSDLNVCQAIAELSQPAVPPTSYDWLFKNYPTSSHGFWVFTRVLSVLFADGHANGAELNWFAELLAVSGFEKEFGGFALSFFLTRTDDFDRAYGETPDRKKWCAILEVPEDATLDTIKAKYREKIFEIHPDRLGGIPVALRKLAEEHAKQINAAYKGLVGPNGSTDSRFMALNGTDWVPLCSMPERGTVFCCLCQQQNRLPEMHQLANARCGRCHASLLHLPEVTTALSNIITDRYGQS